MASWVTILTDNGYIENGIYYFYVRDHLGNNRLVADASGDITQSNEYYPFGMVFAESDTTKQSDQPYKYNGKELDEMHGLNWYDYSARFYDPALPQFTSVDPHAENYYSWSPYAYVGNNPMKFIDPDGRSINPIYDKSGSLLGTDNLGLKGDAIVMNKDNFKQGMSHEEALMQNLGKDGLKDNQALNNLEKTQASLPDRPDYDGKLTLSEANDWYKNGKGKPLYVDAAKIDLFPLSNGIILPNFRTAI